MPGQLRPGGGGAGGALPGGGAAPLVVDRERISAMGLELVERPVASEGGDYARHDPDKLAAAVLELYRQRAVRIFRARTAIS